MLADPGSRTIRAFGMIDPDNTSGNVPEYGMKNTSYPGYFLIDCSGVVRERYVDTGWGDRRTARSLLARMYPELVEGSGPPVRGAHLSVATGQSDRLVAPGSRATLYVDVELPKRMHLYAPGVEGYKPLSLELETSPYFAPEAPVYPKPTVLRLEAIHESVPVFRNRVRIRQDIILAVKTAFFKLLGSDRGKTQPLSVRGKLTYQACDDTICYPPAEFPVSWDLLARPLDLERPAAENRQKG